LVAHAVRKQQGHLECRRQSLIEEKGAEAIMIDVTAPDRAAREYGLSLIA